MVLFLVQMAGGVALLTVGAEFLVRSSVSLARRIGLSPLVIGLTIVSIGTSVPELVVSFDAVFQGSEALGVGNVVGSNISNIALILGISALVSPLRVQADVIRFDGPILVGVSLLLVVFAWDGEVGRLEGGVLAMGVLVYLWYNLRAARHSPDTVVDEFDEGLPSRHRPYRDIAGLVLGIGGLLWGADLLVDGAVEVADLLRVPKVVIGLTVVAVGTSLPELATSVLAAFRGKGDIAIGNAVGSSVLNVLGILGPTAAVEPLTTTSLTLLELGTMVGVAVLLLPLLRTDFILSRPEGGGLVTVYAGYLLLLFFGG